MSISPKKRFEIFKRDKFICQYCGARPSEFQLEIDHIIPRSRGGTDAVDNLKTSCWKCNIGKGSTLLECEKLNPCPFCGGTDLTVIVEDTGLDNGIDIYIFTIKCKRCGARGPSELDSKEGAIGNWNGEMKEE
jgi:Lar family restriction alleviation protein